MVARFNKNHSNFSNLGEGGAKIKRQEQKFCKLDIFTKIWGGQKVGLRGNSQNLGWSKTCKSALIPPLINFTFVEYCQTSHHMLLTYTTLTPYLRTLQALFVGFIASLFAIALLMVPFGGLDEDQFSQPLPSLLTGMAYYSILLVFLDVFLKPKLLKQSIDPMSFLKIFTLFIFFFLTLDILSTWIKLPSLSEPIFDDQFKQNPGIFFVTVVVVAPIMEELVFRGAILGYLRSHSSKLPALLFSSFLFGLIHFSLDQIVWGSIAGIFLGYAYMKSQNILVPIFFHMLNNGMYFILKSYGDASSIWDLFNP